jgi:hypothetical protein
MHHISKIYFVIKLRSKLNPLGSGHITAWNVPIAECGVNNSCWWAQKMPETCRVLWQNKFWICDASSWLFSTKFITMHGHLNINKLGRYLHATVGKIGEATQRDYTISQLCIELLSDIFYFVVALYVRHILRVTSVCVCVCVFACVRVRVYGHVRA